jgi:hypothetical protein
MASYPSFLTMLAYLPGGQDHSPHHSKSCHAQVCIVVAPEQCLTRTI